MGFNSALKGLMSTNGQGKFRHTNGVISQFRIEAAGLGIRRVRIANLPPEVPDRAVRMGLNRYGDVRGTGGKLVTCLSLPSGQWHSNSSGQPIPTYSISRHNSWIPKLNLMAPEFSI
jgi:hypothetical protein